jgi:RHS repeat-associated protein
MPAGTLYEYMITPPGGSSGYAPNGNLLSYTDSVNGTWNFGFSGYDALSRLVSGSASAGHFAGLQMNWSYDSFGNRTGETLGGTTGVSLPTGTTAQYNANNQVTGGSLGYDPAGSGNVIADNANNYLYDGDGRICAVQDRTFGGITGYLYDAGGTRVAKGTLASFDCGSNFTVTSWYIVGPSGEQLTETDGAGNWKHTNVYAAGALIATYEANNTLFALNDWLGTKRVEVGANNNCATGYTSLPFGDGLTPVAVNGYNQCPDDATEHHYTQKERDVETGNDYMFARYYNSNTGRFLSPDWSAKEEPIPYAKLDDPQSLNLYSYVRNNPLSRTDPNGHWCIAGVLGTTCSADHPPAPPPPPPPPVNQPGVLPPPTPAQAPGAAPAPPVSPIVAGVGGRLFPGADGAAQAAKQATRGIQEPTPPPVPRPVPGPDPVISPQVAPGEVPEIQPGASTLEKLGTAALNLGKMLGNINPDVIVCVTCNTPEGRKLAGLPPED